mmetsp:Transcript_17450/g.17374  ORF Transcript_17450/g.17374 Transcript_17450/m.17374 type:complete len:84 (+) Transcript_17450:110-361(+)
MPSNFKHRQLATPEYESKINSPANKSGTGNCTSFGDRLVSILSDLESGLFIESLMCISHEAIAYFCKLNLTTVEKSSLSDAWL